MTTRPSGSLTAELADLVTSVREVVAEETDTSDVAAGVATVLSDRLAKGLPLPEHLRGHDPERYTQHIVHVEPSGTFSIVALVWLPGQTTPVHDHVSWCVTGVVEGQESEETYEVREEDGRPYLVRAGEKVNAVGSVSALDPPGDVHRVWNSCRELAVSLHIYGADIHELGSSIRRVYDLPVLDR
ncbi:cysteine dioxygenase family protein [Saccharomonospora sp. NB11]|jgi:predicted metal-dependent enzyme (double-stranded beta helix superfamily)|uniref:cysteine dioxygenase family protein n=1 Tax=Saccharomonospora sp. NB11 TaxID=1642298 RepID=UPI0018D14AC1|nr:cysteine dioxygenase family protein [Saccharomonospora sp. NB11]